MYRILLSVIIGAISIMLLGASTYTWPPRMHRAKLVVTNWGPVSADKCMNVDGWAAAASGCANYVGNAHLNLIPLTGVTVRRLTCVWANIPTNGGAGDTIRISMRWRDIDGTTVTDDTTQGITFDFGSVVAGITETAILNASPPVANALPSFHIETTNDDESPAAMGATAEISCYADYQSPW